MEQVKGGGGGKNEEGKRWMAEIVGSATMLRAYGALLDGKALLMGGGSGPWLRAPLGVQRAANGGHYLITPRPGGRAAGMARVIHNSMWAPGSVPVLVATSCGCVWNWNSSKSFGSAPAWPPNAVGSIIGASTSYAYMYVRTYVRSASDRLRE